MIQYYKKIVDRRSTVVILLGLLLLLASADITVEGVEIIAGVHNLALDCSCIIMMLSIGGLGIGMSRTVLSRAQGMAPKIEVEDLIERKVVPLSTHEVEAVLAGKIILVTGAAGSIGSELTRQVLDLKPQRVIALDTNETGLFDLVEMLKAHPYAERLAVSIGDITDSLEMERLLARERPQIIFHAAAYKHVPMLESFPEQAVRTNVLATYSLCHMAQKHQIERFVFISTDKAAMPTGTMGASKRVGEMIIQALARTTGCSTRF